MHLVRMAVDDVINLDLVAWYEWYPKSVDPQSADRITLYLSMFEDSQGDPGPWFMEYDGELAQRLFAYINSKVVTDLSLDAEPTAALPQAEDPNIPWVPVVTNTFTDAGLSIISSDRESFDPSAG